MVEHKASATGVASAQAGARAGIIHHFSRQHLAAARFFRDQSALIEQHTTERPAPQEKQTRHRAFVTGAIMSAVAGLESSINELFLMAQRKDTTNFPNQEPRVMELLATLWESSEGASILDKYQIALVSANRERFDKGAQPFQDADLVVKLRNTLVHYKPELDLEPNSAQNFRLIRLIHRARCGSRINVLVPVVRAGP
jgi:hypothetical protein